jgi:hypothetical protein
MIKRQWNAKVEAPRAEAGIMACVRVFKTLRPSFHFHRQLPYATLSVLLLLQSGRRVGFKSLQRGSRDPLPANLDFDDVEVLGDEWQPE